MYTTEKILEELEKDLVQPLEAMNHSLIEDGPKTLYMKICELLGNVKHIREEGSPTHINLTRAVYIDARNAIENEKEPEPLLDWIYKHLIEDLTGPTV